MKKIILHIGTGKTGSTALQQFLFRNSAAFEKSGYSVRMPEGYSEGQISSGNDCGLSKQLIQQQKNQAKSTLEEFLAAPQIPIISSEILAEIPMEAWALFRQIARELDVEITLVVYLRNVLPYHISAYDQMVKRHGEHMEFASWHSTYDSVYAKVIKMACVLGTDVIRAIHYDSHRGDVITPFLEVLGVDALELDAEPFRTKVINRSLSHLERDLLKEVNRLAGDRLSEDISNAFLMRWPAAATDRPDLPSEVEHDFVMRFQWQVDAINRKLFQGGNILKVFDRRGTSASSDSSPLNPVRDSMTREEILRVALETVVEQNVRLAQSLAENGKNAVLQFCSGLVDAVKFRSKDVARKLPDDFHPMEYGILNPDVLIYGMDPTKHYLDHGKAEGRIYRIDQLIQNF